MEKVSSSSSSARGRESGEPLTLKLSNSLSLSLSQTLSRTLSLSNSQTLSRKLSNFLSLKLSLSQTLKLSNFLSLKLSLKLSSSLFLSSVCITNSTCVLYAGRLKEQDATKVLDNFTRRKVSATVTSGVCALLFAHRLLCRSAPNATAPCSWTGQLSRRP